MTFTPLGSPITGVGGAGRGCRSVAELAGVAAPAGEEGAVRVEEGVGAGAGGEGHVAEGQLLGTGLDEAGQAEVVVAVEAPAPGVAVRVDGQAGVEGHRVGERRDRDAGREVDLDGLGLVRGQLVRRPSSP